MITSNLNPAAAPLLRPRVQRPVAMDDVIDSISFSWPQLLVAAALVLFCALTISDLSGAVYLGATLQCSWGLTYYDTALLQAVSRAGMLAGSVVWGLLGDLLGRRPLLPIVVLLTVVFSVLAALSPTFGWVLMLRAAVGFSIAGVYVLCATLSMELFSAPHRARIINSIFILSSITMSLGVLLWTTAMPALGWRSTLLLLAAPRLMVLFLVAVVPHSPRFLSLCGHDEAATRELHRLIGAQGSPLTTRQIQVSATAPTGCTATLRDLFSPRLRATTLLLLLVWFVSAFASHGSVYAASLPWATPRRCFPDITPGPLGDGFDDGCCPRITGATYTDAVLGVIGPMACCFLNCLLLDWMGRRIGMAAWAAVACLAVLGLNLCMPSAARQFLFFILSGATIAFASCMYIYTGERFPTSVRATGLGLCGAASQLGFILCAYPEQVFPPRFGILPVFIVYLFAFLIVILATILLRVDTAGVALQQTVPETPVRRRRTSSNTGYSTFELQR